MAGLYIAYNFKLQLTSCNLQPASTQQLCKRRKWHSAIVFAVQHPGCFHSLQISTVGPSYTIEFPIPPAEAVESSPLNSEVLKTVGNHPQGSLHTAQYKRTVADSGPHSAAISARSTALSNAHFSLRYCMHHTQTPALH